MPDLQTAASDYLSECWIVDHVLTESFPHLKLEENSSNDLLINLVRNELGETEAKNRVNLIKSYQLEESNDIKKLIENGKYLKALNIINKNIELYPNRLACLPLWLLRIILYIKIKDYKKIEKEVETFLNFDYSEFCVQNSVSQEQNLLHDENISQTIVPFSFRLLYALFPFYFENYDLACNRLTALLIKAKTISLKLSALDSSNADVLSAKQGWFSRIQKIELCLVTCYIMLHDHTTAYQILQGHVNDDSPTERSVMASDVIDLKLYITRVLIQLGNLDLAKKYLENCETSVETLNSLPYNSQTENSPNRFYGYLALHRGLLRMADSNFTEAKAEFLKSHEFYPLLKPIALNNLALSLLYSGHMSDAIDLIEKEIDADSDGMMQSDIIFNLCSMYELRSSEHIYHKRILLQKISRIKGDSFDSECFKLGVVP